MILPRVCVSQRRTRTNLPPPSSGGEGPCRKRLAHKTSTSSSSSTPSISKTRTSCRRCGSATFRAGAGAGRINGHGVVRLRPSFQPSSIFNPTLPAEAVNARQDQSAVTLQQRVDQLVWNYRLQGHLIAQIDPLGFNNRPNIPELATEFFGFTSADLAAELPLNPLPHGNVQTLGDLFATLREIYSGHVGVEYMHINDPAMRAWVQRRLEATIEPPLTPAEKRHFLKRLTDAATFDQFALRKYIGSKVFSIEGAEVLIPLLDAAIEKAAEQGIMHIVMAMAHRGRLAVLANILGKQPRRIFAEFQDQARKFAHGGDVKYHLGHRNTWTARSGRKVLLSLCFNPSHLEFVNPVALGALRAKEDRDGDIYHEHGMAILIHGDAAIAGEGIVQETLNLVPLRGYFTGGTLHIVINNQIGFTTPPQMSRAGVYCTDIAKMLETPIIHVNGDEPEAVMRALGMAMDFRNQFHTDVMLDVCCYRRHGHNESDEPEFTQPILYKRIKGRKAIRDLYAERLAAEGTVSDADYKQIQAECIEHLEAEYAMAQQGDISGPSYETTDVWRGYRAGHEPIDDQVVTAIEATRLSEILEGLCQMPLNFHLHPKLEKWMARRVEMARGQAPLDWAAGEALALATLATDGFRIRLTGQDSGRGTFSHRHAVLYDYHDGHAYMPLARVAPDQAPVEIIDSPLSEAGALGFEYGYSLEYPDCFVAWEGQFGDFSNVAQVIIDQFIATADEKWSHLSGITLLLPHGFEGQGPEHSGARLERFLNLSCEDNIQVVSPTTPAQLFHCLRRQMLRRWLKPLVVMTPKSLLRHPSAASSLEDLAIGRFQRLIPDPSVDPAGVRAVLLCSGKIYYELLEKREAAGRRDRAIVRVEQLYPFPEEQLSSAPGRLCSRRAA